MRRTITRYNRILSAVLAFVLLFGALPMPAFSVESEQDPLAAEVTVETPHITLDGEQTDFMELRPYEKLDILVEGADEEANYQWQILHPKKDDMWINIYNANAQSIAVTLALVGNMLNDEDVTQLRCRMTVDGVQSHTDPITVQFLEEDTSIIVLEETVPVLETPEETEPATEATEAPAETEPVTEATEAPAETEPVTEATEAPVETEPATEATEAPVETEPVTEATEAPVETEPVTEATEAPAETEPGMEALEPVEETQPVVLALEPVEETQPVVLALEPEPAAEEPQPVVTETEPLEVPAAAPTPAADVVVAPETVQASEENATLLAEGDEADSDFVTVTIEYMRYDIKWQDGKMVVDDQGEPVLEETGVQAFTPYIATLQKGTDLNTSVHNPSMVGYNTYLEDTACTEVVINETAITENKVYTVKYKPAEVNYSVRYYFQNIYDDLYAENTTLKPTVNGKGYTGATPPESQLRGDVPGFTALYYQPDSIAADGSTVFEVYYERNYYLMEFDCNGGYGAETLYNRYDSYVSVPTPVRPGYVFAGWDLVESEEPGFVHDEDAEGHLDKIPPYHTAYKAIWETSATTYTVVYWRENADDDGYSYWGSVQVGANADGTPDGTVKSNDHVSGTDHITATGLTEAAYFSYNAVKTELEESKRTDLGSDGKVIVEGDGSTVVNVYYSRNYYTINIRAQGKCQLHVHGTDCQKRLLCGQGDHVHSAECVKNLICDIPEHAAHTAACLRCEETEHPVHTDSCYNCGQEEHTHSAANGCTLSCTHVHSVKCYGGQNSADIESNYLSAIKNIGDANPESGYVYHISYSFFGTTNKYYLYYNNKWYEVNAGNISGSLLGSGEYSSRYGITYTAKKYLAKLSCEHSSHTDACYTCEKTVHTHSDTCGYKDEIHVHGASCYKDEIHIHTDACYSWTCGASAHTHTDACYGECIYPDHTHTNSCSSSSGTNTVKQVTRKYGADLSDIWPIVDGNGVRYDSGQRWKPSGSTTYSQVLVFIKNMPGDDFTLELDKSSNDTYTMHYYVEALNDSEATREYNGKKFKLAFDPVKANYNYITRDEDFFDIAGFTQWASNPTFGGNDQIDIDGGGNVYFYYERKVSTLKFHNINTTVQTVADLMYEYPLKDVTVAGNPASAYVPPYPSTYEPNAYEFGGWYTTPDCFDGTEVDWTAAKMPSTDMEIYAKWTPIVRTVTFYSAYSDIAKDEADDSKEYHFMKADNVPHGTNLGSTYYDIPEWPEDLDRETTGGAEADKYDSSAGSTWMKTTRRSLPPTPWKSSVTWCCLPNGVPALTPPMK